jgi:hypothetical protein
MWIFDRRFFDSVVIFVLRYFFKHKVMKMSAIRTAQIAIATPQSDARLRAENNAAGHAARRADLARSACPHDPQSLVAQWWFEGYDNGVSGPVSAS